MDLPPESELTSPIRPNRGVRPREVVERKKPFLPVTIGEYKVLTTLPHDEETTLKLVEDQTGAKMSMYAIKPKYVTEEIVMNEVYCQSCCQDHPNIATCKDFMHTQRKMYLVMDHVHLGDMFDFVQGHGGRIAEFTAMQMIQQILSAVAHMHEHNICHRDIKPENILIDENGTETLLTGFHSAIEWNPVSSPLLDDDVGAIRCLPPEVFVRSYDPRSLDVWMCGIVFFYMLSGRFPFEGPDQDSTMRNIVAHHFVHPMPPNLSPHTRSLLQEILHPDPEQRPQAQDLLKHQFFQQGTSLKQHISTGRPFRAKTCPAVSCQEIARVVLL